MQYNRMGSTIRFFWGGGIGSFQEKKITLAMRMRKEKNHHCQGAKEKKSSLSTGKFFVKFSEIKKFILMKVMKKSTPVNNEKKSTLTKLPTPWKANGASLTYCLQNKQISVFVTWCTTLVPLKCTQIKLLNKHCKFFEQTHFIPTQSCYFIVFKEWKCR